MRFLAMVCCALALALGPGCATKIVMKPTGYETGRGVDAGTGELLDRRDDFKVSDSQAVAWAEFENAHGPHTARFRWTNPADLLVLDSGPLRVAPDDQLYAVRRVWSALPIRNSPAQLMPGKWRVEVWFDEKRVETLKLRIKE